MSFLRLLCPVFWIRQARDWVTWQEEWTEATTEDYRVLENMATGWRRWPREDAA